MSGCDEGYALAITSRARRDPTEVLPGAVAAAAYELVTGPLLEPQRLGKRLRPPLEDRSSARRGTYRIVYRIDEEKRVVTVVGVSHRADAYRR